MITKYMEFVNNYFETCSLGIRKTKDISTKIINNLSVFAISTGIIFLGLLGMILLFPVWIVGTLSTPSEKMGFADLFIFVIAVAVLGYTSLMGLWMLLGWFLKANVVKFFF